VVTKLDKLTEIGINKKQAHQWQTIASMPEEELLEHLEDSKNNGEEITTADIYRNVRRELKRSKVINELENISTIEAKAIEGVYDVVVIDPPWDMKKIERDVAPNQVEFDYPTMSEDELIKLHIPCAENCHVWLWTTHKHLPLALRLIDVWGFKYVCTFVWHKPGGFQPFGLPQYNAEFILYARYGSPVFIDTKNFNVCFNAERKGHSVKPEEFYSMVRRVTAGRRLDMFSRRNIDGFDGWGNQI
jgi:N6-adenosine-specific RNA methylase IME4